MNRVPVQLKMSKELKAALQQRARDQRTSLTGLLLVSVAMQHPDLKDLILRER